MKSCLNTEPNNNDSRINEHEKMVNCINEEGKEIEGDEEFGISDSETKEYKEAIRKLLKFRNYEVSAPNGQFRCPFCVGVDKLGYQRLLEHAVRVAEGSTGSANQRANHSAMAKYLVIDLASDEKSMLTLEEKDETLCNASEGYSLRIAKDQSKGVLEHQEMLNFENKILWLNSWEEELDKREVALMVEKKKMDDFLREKNDCDLLYQHNLAEERPINDELLEAGKELIKGLENMSSHCCVNFGGTKRSYMEEKAFMNACKKKYLLNDAETKAFELCCFWVKKWSDAKRDPQRLLKEKDELPRGLKAKCGDKIYNAVVEYNSNVNGMELWNFKEGRKASHCEVIRYIFTQWETLQRERDREKSTEVHEESWENKVLQLQRQTIANAKEIQKAKTYFLNKPKLPPYAFFDFMEDFRETYKKKYPNTKSIATVAKAGADKWETMTKAEKAPYEAKAEKKRQEYEKLMNDSSGDEGSERSPYSELEEDDTCSS